MSKLAHSNDETMEEIDLRNRLRDLMDERLASGVCGGTFANSAAVEVPRALTINELLAALLRAHTGKTWKVTDHAKDYEGWYKLPASQFSDELWVCHPDSARRALQEIYA